MEKNFKKNRRGFTAAIFLDSILALSARRLCVLFSLTKLLNVDGLLHGLTFDN